ncbi:MAG: hypothetical protein V5B30_06105 [Candidatus Accumulibacter delftensis]|jgi:hypothetical protein
MVAARKRKLRPLRLEASRPLLLAAVVVWVAALLVVAALTESGIVRCAKLQRKDGGGASGSSKTMHSSTLRACILRSKGPLSLFSRRMAISLSSSSLAVNSLPAPIGARR